MIDFRYHLVSIIAIFFALAAGIVLGAGPLGESATGDLSTRLDNANEQIRELRDERDTFEEELIKQNEFIDTVGSELVAGELSGENVAVIVLPGAEDNQVNAVHQILIDAGATSDLRVGIQPEWNDPGSEAVLDDLASEYASSDAEELPEDADGYARGATVLASALLEVPAEGAGTASLGQLDREVITAYEEAGLIRLQRDATSRSSLAVVVAGPLSSDDAADRAGREATLASSLDAASEGVVVGGPPITAEDGGVLSAIRSGDAARDVSTVDNITRMSGRVTVVYALDEQKTGEAGQYGIVGDADLMPERDETDASGGRSDEGEAS